MLRVRGGGFRPIGRVDAEGTGLPLAQARQLLLEHGWASVAGEGISRRARAIAVRRGVLEIAIDEPQWAIELAPLLPRITGRLARRLPDLGVKRFRVCVAGGVAAAPLPPDLPATEEAEQAPSSETVSGPSAPEAAEITTGRLVEVARRYLRRSEGDAGREE